VSVTVHVIVLYRHIYIFIILQNTINSCVEFLAITGPSVSQLVITVLEFSCCQYYNIYCRYYVCSWTPVSADTRPCHPAHILLYFITLILILFTVQINDDDVFCEGDTRNITEHLYIQIRKTASRTNSELVFKSHRLEQRLRIHFSLHLLNKAFNTVAKSIRGHILHAQRRCDTLPFPPSLTSSIRCVRRLLFWLTSWS